MTTTKQAKVVLGEQGGVLAAAAERRQFQLHRVEPVEQISLDPVLQGLTREASAGKQANAGR